MVAETTLVPAVGFLAKQIAPSAVKLAGSIGTRQYAALRVKFFKIFEAYLESTRQKVTFGKNIIHRNEKVPILEQYVNVHFSRDGKVVTDYEISQNVIHGKRYLISGTAGAGKTMFLKWITLTAIENIEHHQIIPIFIELRDLNGYASEENLEDMIFSKVANAKVKNSKEEFLIGLSGGVFVLILDAVDEIAPAMREPALKKIEKFLHFYPDCGCIITTRQNSGLEGNQELEVVHTEPMTLDQIVSVIGKIRFDDEVKSKLIEELRAGLYERLKSFISNPLLATIMLLSFSYSGEIPTKMSLFYKQAFVVLFHQHDTMKGTLYKREHYAKLQVDEFEMFFAVFCYKTFIDSSFEFSEADLNVYIRETCESLAIIKDPMLIRKDLEESVCLIQPNGLEYIFAHRSFQEYFAAVFISRYRGKNLRQVVERACGPGFGDNVVRMLMEISPEVAETEHVLPNLTKWLKTVDTYDASDPAKLKPVARKIFGGFSFGEGDGIIQSLYHSPGLQLLIQLNQCYPGLIFKELFGGKPLFESTEDLSLFIDKVRLRSGKMVEFYGDSVIIRWPEVGVLPEIFESDLPRRIAAMIAALATLRNSIVERNKSRVMQIQPQISRPGSYSR